MLRKKPKYYIDFMKKTTNNDFLVSFIQNSGKRFGCCRNFAHLCPKQLTFIMKNYSQDIMDYALSHPQFGLHELYSYLDKEGNKDISHNVVIAYRIIMH